MRVAIVGGGISGLALAHYLRASKGEPVEAVVFDPAPGGPIGTLNVEGCILETGPESWLASKPWAEQLIREVGLGDEICGSNDAERRTFVLRDGRFVTLPEGLQMVVPTRMLPVIETRLFSWATKIRMGLEVFRSPKTMPDRSVTDFVTDHFGSEAVDYLAEPLLAGVYGGSPDELSAASVLPKFVEYEQRFGSVVVGTLRDKRKPSGKPIFQSLRRGVGSLISVLLDETTLVRAPVQAIQKDQGWQVYAEEQWHAFDRVVLCCGAKKSAPLLAQIDPEAASLLTSIPYSGSSIWTLGYRRSDIKHPLDAFGFLVPRPERGAVMACTWVATKWKGRVPDDKAVLRCFSTNPDVSLEETKADLLRLMGVDAEPIFVLHHKWPDSMPQYTVGHARRVAEIEDRIAHIPGLYVAGNAFHGIGIPDCIKSAKNTAEKIVSGR